MAIHGMTKKDREQMAERLRTIRIAAGLTQYDLADLTGITQVTISALENARQSPTRRTILQLAEGLGMAPTKLVG